MVYLKGWPRVLRQQTGNNCSAIILDHGPIFKLATLNEFGPESLKSPELELWWQCMFKQWAGILDLVIWLDAPDRILRERINTRSQNHAIKGKSEQEASKFLKRYRTSYKQILVKLTAYDELKLLEFNTSQASINQIVDKLLII
jgi:thymidylate kinase